MGQCPKGSRPHKYLAKSWWNLSWVRICFVAPGLKQVPVKISSLLPMYHVGMLKAPKGNLFCIFWALSSPNFNILAHYNIFGTILIDDNLLNLKLAEIVNPSPLDSTHYHLTHTTPQPSVTLRHHPLDPLVSNSVDSYHPRSSHLLLEPYHYLAEFCVQFWLPFHGKDHLVLSNSIR